MCLVSLAPRGKLPLAASQEKCHSGLGNIVQAATNYRVSARRTATYHLPHVTSVSVSKKFISDISCDILAVCRVGPRVFAAGNLLQAQKHRTGLETTQQTGFTCCPQCGLLDCSSGTLFPRVEVRGTELRMRKAHATCSYRWDTGPRQEVCWQAYIGCCPCLP